MMDSVPAAPAAESAPAASTAVTDMTVATYFDEASKTWDQTTERSGDKHLAIARLAGVQEGMRVLDLGCGTGIMAPAYLALGARQVVGVDVSAGMIEHARAKWADEPRLRFVCGDILDYDGRGGFDLVVVYNAYPHFMDKTALVQKAATLLAADGRFLVAHGMGRAHINSHHANVPKSVTSELLPAAREAKVWEDGGFAIDILVDTPHIYAFGGHLD